VVDSLTAALAVAAIVLIGFFKVNSAWVILAAAAAGLFV
jgi:hypothetical protein